MVRPNATVAERQAIAGKEQAKQDAAHSWCLSDRLRWAHHELETLAEEGQALQAAGKDVPKVNRSEVLRATYVKTAGRPEKDGAMV